MIRVFPKVVQAVPGKNYTVYAYMQDGWIRLFDARPLIEAGGVFEPLQDPHVFAKCLTVLNGTVAWDLTGKHDPTDCIDIDPFTIDTMEAVDDPLAE